MSQRAPAVNKAKESRSAAVRAALANPSRRQLSKWQRERRQRRIVLYSFTALAIVVAVVLAFGYWREQLVRPNETAASVGSETIPVGALVQRVKPMVAALDQEMARVSMQGSGAPGAPPDSSSSQQQLRMLQSQRFSLVDQTLTDMIDEELVRVESVKRNILVTPEEIDTRIASDLERQRIIPQPPPDPSAAVPLAADGATPTPTVRPTFTADERDDAYKNFLARINFTEQQYRTYVESLLQKDKLRDALVADQATIQEQVHARRLTVGTQEDATSALAQIRSGEQTLEALAREKSLDITSKQNGGDLGWLPRGLESPQFDEAAFRLRVGELGEPVITPQGWEIIEVLERELRPLTTEQLDRLKAKAMDQWVRQARDDPSVKRDLDKDRRDWVQKQAGITPRTGPASRGLPGGLPGGF